MNKKIGILILALMAPLAAMASSKTVTGVLVDSQFIDSARIAVRTAQGKTIDAYCDGHCGDWFTTTADGNSEHLKKAFIGKKVTLRYADEVNGDRVVGPGDDSIETFVKELRFSK